jgi:hypothetical protein
MNTDWSFAMHNCRETQAQITELLLDRADRRPDEVLAAELHRCAECRSEFDALNATLRITTRLKEISSPSENYWIGYHARLRHTLESGNKSNSPRRSWFVRFVRSSIPVPAPLAVVAILLCAILVPLAIRSSQQEIAPIPSVVHVPIEVPVIQEKVVTQLVYRERRSRARTSQRVVDAAKVEGSFAKSQEVPSLVGFKPSEEVKLTVIKGGSTNEK